MNLHGHIFLFSLCVLVVGVVGPPVKENKPPSENEVDDTPERFTMEYARYLQEVVQALEDDEGFRSKLQNASEDDIKSGKIAEELDLVGHHVRNRLDELKRTELERIRHLSRQQMELEQGFDRRQLKVPKHLDHRNEHTFEIEDLKRLILQTTKDLEETDRKRRKEFKEYELEKEHQRVEKLKALDDEHRKTAQMEWEEQQKKHREHPRLHHPGSKQQMEEVWEKQDHLPKEEFDHKTFFRMHDLNGDNHWSQEEVNALFQNELNKMYDPDAPEDDIRERYEEMERMREHVFNETDTDRDGRISFEEFIVQTKKQEFEQDPGWQGLDEEPIFTQEELQEYERRRMEDMARMAAAGVNPYGGHPPGMGQPHYMPPVHPGPVYQQPLPPHHGAPMHQQQQQMHHQQQQIPHHQQQQIPHHQQQQIPHHQQQQQMAHHQQQMQQQYHQAQLQQHPKSDYQLHGGMHDSYQQPPQQQQQQQQFQQQQQQFQQQQQYLQQQQQQQFQQQQQQQQQFQQKQAQPNVPVQTQHNQPQPPVGIAQTQTAVPAPGEPIHGNQGQTITPSQPVANAQQTMTAAPVLSNNIGGQAALPVVPAVNPADSNKVPLTAK